MEAVLNVPSHQEPNGGYEIAKNELAGVYQCMGFLTRVRFFRPSHVRSVIRTGSYELPR